MEFIQDITQVWAIAITALLFDAFADISVIFKLGLLVVSFAYTAYKLFRLVAADIKKHIDKRVDDILEEEDDTKE